MTTLIRTTEQIRQPDQRRPSPRRHRVGGRTSYAGLAFVLPGFIVYAVVMLYPAVQTLIMSLYDWNIRPGGESTWLGLDNYIRAFEDPAFTTAMVNAAVYTLVTVPLQVVIGMILAVLLDAHLP